MQWPSVLTHQPEQGFVHNVVCVGTAEGIVEAILIPVSVTVSQPETQASGGACSGAGQARLRGEKLHFNALKRE